MKLFLAAILTLSFVPLVHALTLADRSWFAALKEADVILVGTATKLTVIEDPKASRNGVFNHGRLQVKVNRIVLPEGAKAEKVVEVDFGYNIGNYAADGYVGKELVYVLKQKSKGADGSITRGQALRWWLFAYRPDDLAKVLALRQKLLDGGDPTLLQNNRPYEVFSAKLQSPARK